MSLIDALCARPTKARIIECAHAWLTAACKRGIDLRMPVRSIRRHRQARTRLIVVIVALAVVAALAVRWAVRNGLFN